MMYYYEFGIPRGVVVRRLEVMSIPCKFTIAARYQPLSREAHTAALWPPAIGTGDYIRHAKKNDLTPLQAVNNSIDY